MTEFDQVLYKCMYVHWYYLRCDCKSLLFAKLFIELQSLIYVKILFLLNILLDQKDIIRQNVVCTLILLRYRLGLLIVIFRKFVIELGPFIDVRISFPPNIMRTIEHNLTKFCIQFKFAQPFSTSEVKR